MTQLDWRHVEKKDVRDLHGFCCAETRAAATAGGRPAPPVDPWACEAQAFVRAGKPRKPPRYMLVGRDHHGAIGAAARFREDDGCTFFLIEVVAIANHWRRHRIGDEAVAQVLNNIAQLALDKQVPSVVIQANVHRDNKPSLAMLERWGFREQWREGDYLTFATEFHLGR